MGKRYLRLDIIYLLSRTEERDLAHFYKCLILVSPTGEYLFFARPKKRHEKVALVHPCTRDIRASCTSKAAPDALAPNNTLGLPGLLTIANVPFKFASMLS